MNRNTVVTTWREVCGSDTVMAMPLTGRILEEFACRIAEAEREACAKFIRSQAMTPREELMFYNIADALMRMRSNAQDQPGRTG